MKTPLYLLKDIVIPAGTRFDQAPEKTERGGEGHVSHIVGLSKDTSGDFVYFAGEPGSVEREQLKEFFSETPPATEVPIDAETLAEVLYEEYCKAVGGTAFNGDPLPDWDTFYADPNKVKQANAWIVTAAKAIELLRK